MIGCSWQTIAQFARNDRQLHGETSAIAVLHPPAASTSTPTSISLSHCRRRRQSPLLANPALQTETAPSVPHKALARSFAPNCCRRSPTPV